MAIANAGTVQVDFAANAVQFNRQLQQVNSRLKSMEGGLRSLAGVARQALGFLSIGVATNFIRSAAEAADNAGKLADKLGISTERLAAFQLAAADAGTSQETLNKLLLDAQRRLGDATFGTGEALKVLQSFDLNIRDLQKLAPDELFLRYADAIGTLKTRSDQFSAAQALFGRSAQEAFTLISAGRPAIEDAAATVDRLGLALSRVDAAKIEVANDKLGLLARTSRAFGQQLAAALAPFVTEFVDRLTSTGIAADEARSKLDAFARSAFIAFEIIADAFRAIDGVVSFVFERIARMSESSYAAIRRTFELVASAQDAIGLDSLAERSREAARRLGEAEQTSASIAENAAQRVENAANNIKSFAQIFDEADHIIARSQARAEETARRQAELNAGLGQGTDTDARIEQINADLLIEEDLRNMSHDRMIEQRKIFLETMNDLTKELDVNEFVRHQEARVKYFNQAEEAMFAARQQFQNATLGLLQTLAVKSKAAAIALVLINKGRAIAEAIQNTEVAATAALAKGDPYTAAARAAAIRALGYASVAVIAATGFQEIANIRSSPAAGAPLGSPQNPVFTDSTDGSQPGAQQRNQINVTVQGVITDGAIREIADALKDVIDNADVHIISSTSSQARELRGD